MICTFGTLGSYGRPPRNPQSAPAPQQSPAAPWQVGSPANMASIKDLQVRTCTNHHLTNKWSYKNI